jgi:hypothetical protein
MTIFCSLSPCEWVDGYQHVALLLHYDTLPLLRTYVACIIEIKRRNHKLRFRNMNFFSGLYETFHNVCAINIEFFNLKQVVCIMTILV